MKISPNIYQFKDLIVIKQWKYQANNNIEIGNIFSILCNNFLTFPDLKKMTER